MAGTIFDLTTNVALSNGGRTATPTGNNATAQSSAARKSGKWTIEFTLDAADMAGTNTMMGLATIPVAFKNAGAVGGNWAVRVSQGGTVYFGGSASSSGSLGTAVAGDKFYIEVDCEAGLAAVRRNGGTAITGTISKGTYLAPAVQFGTSTGGAITLNSGDVAFAHPPTEGYDEGWPEGGDPVVGTVFAPATGITLSNGGLTATPTGINVFAQSPDARNIGKWAVEFTLDTYSAGSQTMMGLATIPAAFALSTIGGGNWAVRVNQSGAVYFNGSSASGGSVGTPAAGDKFSIEVNLDARTASVRRNGGTPVTGSFSGVYLSPAVQFASSTAGVITLNSGDTPFTYPPTAGYTAGWPAPGETTTLLANNARSTVWGSGDTPKLRTSQLAVEVWRASASLAGSSLVMTSFGVSVWMASFATVIERPFIRRRRPIVVQSAA